MLAPEHEARLLAYCAEDVRATAELFRAMRGWLAEELALYRGRYVAEVARMEHLGIPIDLDSYERLSERWDDLLVALHREMEDCIEDAPEGKLFRKARHNPLRDGRASCVRRLAGALEARPFTFREGEPMDKRPRGACTRATSAAPSANRRRPSNEAVERAERLLARLAVKLLHHRKKKGTEDVGS